MKKQNSVRRVLGFAPMVGALIAVISCLFVLTSNVGAQETGEVKPAPIENPNTPATDTPGEETPAEDTGVSVVTNKNQRFDFKIVDNDIRQVLRFLSMRFEKNLVVSKGVEGNVTAELYDMDFESGLEALLHITKLVKVEKGNVTYIYTAAEFAALDREMITTTYHLAYLTATDARALVEKLLSADGKISITPATDTGLSSNEEEKRTTNIASEIIVIRDYKKNVSDIKRVLGLCDVRPDQVMIEATILSVELQDNEDMGVDLSVLAGTTFSKFGATGTVSGLPTGGAVPFPGNPKALIGSHSTVNIPDDATGGLSFGFVSGNVAAFIRAIERLRDTSILANPKLMVLNKQRAQVLVGAEEGYIAATTATDTSSVSTVEFLETGTKLVVRPFVGKDGYVRLEIFPEISTGSVRPVGEGDNSVALPEKSTTKIITSVMVRDGRTLVIGGLFQENNVRNRSQVPILGDIKGLGDFFKYAGDRSTRRELIILLTPHIIRFPKEEELANKVKEEMDNIRLASRKGLVWWTRFRLADFSMSEARRHLSMGETEKAIWHVERALAMSPTRADARALKEKLVPKAPWCRRPRNLDSCYLIERLIKQDHPNLEDRRNMPHHGRIILTPEQEKKAAQKAPAAKKETIPATKIESAPVIVPEPKPAPEPKKETKTEIPVEPPVPAAPKEPKPIKIDEPKSQAPAEKEESVTRTTSVKPVPIVLPTLEPEKPEPKKVQPIKIGEPRSKFDPSKLKADKTLTALMRNMK